MNLRVRPEYTEIYGIDISLLSMPKTGESIRDYVKRSGLGKEENILAVVNGRAKQWNYMFSDSDDIEIYPMAASG